MIVGEARVKKCANYLYLKPEETLKIPLSSLSSERVFSEVEALYDKNRSHLTGEHAEMLCLLHHNMVFIAFFCQFFYVFKSHINIVTFYVLWSNLISFLSFLLFLRKLFIYFKLTYRRRKKSHFSHFIFQNKFCSVLMFQNEKSASALKRLY